jgi:hypothetical protein
VNRLRERASDEATGAADWPTDLTDAADEITRLRAALADSQARLASEVRSYQARLADAQRDIHAYRGALGYAVPGAYDGRLADGTFPVCGLCGAKERQLAAARALLFEVASAGIEHHTTSYVVLQLPLVTWDALEQMAQEKP